jgi:hypothetical protein
MVQLIGNSKQFVTAARENKLKGVVAHFLNGRLEAVDLVLNRNRTKSGATALKTLGMFPPKKNKAGHPQVSAKPHQQVTRHSSYAANV